MDPRFLKGQHRWLFACQKRGEILFPALLQREPGHVEGHHAEAVGGELGRGLCPERRPEATCEQGGQYKGNGAEAPPLQIDGSARQRERDAPGAEGQRP